MPPLAENHLVTLAENPGTADWISPYYSTCAQNGTLDLLLLRPIGATIDVSPKGFDL